MVQPINRANDVYCTGCVPIKIENGISCRIKCGICLTKFPFHFLRAHRLPVREDTLLDLVEYMTSKVGLVHQLPFTCDREGFAATFEKVSLGALPFAISSNFFH